MDAAERARLICRVASGVADRASFLLDLRQTAEEQLGQAEQAARQDERRKLTQTDPGAVIVHSVACATQSLYYQAVEPECTCGAVARYWMQRALNERRKVLEQAAEIAEKRRDCAMAHKMWPANCMGAIAKTADKLAEEYRALAEEVT